MYIKQQNHYAQSLIEKYIEPIGVLKQLYTEISVDLNFLKHCWTTLLKNHPHDDICGYSIDGVHDDNETRFREVVEISKTLITQSIEEMVKVGFLEGYESDHRYKDVFLFNPHPFEYNFRIKTKFIFANEDSIHEEQKIPFRTLRAYDAFGKPIQLTITGSQSPYLDAQFIQHTWGESMKLNLVLLFHLWHISSAVCGDV